MKNRNLNLTNLLIIGISSATLPTISQAAPVSEIVEDLGKMGARGSGYQASHDSDNGGAWLFLGFVFIVIVILVSVFKKKR